MSALSAIGLAIYLSRRSYQVDIDVYLMGGKHILLGDLYSVQFGKPFLRFTYPPFAALAFLPMARALPFGRHKQSGRSSTWGRSLRS